MNKLTFSDGQFCSVDSELCRILLYDLKIILLVIYISGLYCHTMCSRSSYPFYIVSYYKKYVTTALQVWVVLDTELAGLLYKMRQDFLNRQSIWCMFVVILFVFCFQLKIVFSNRISGKRNRISGLIPYIKKAGYPVQP